MFVLYCIILYSAKVHLESSDILIIHTLNKHGRVQGYHGTCFPRITLETLWTSSSKPLDFIFNISYGILKVSRTHKKHLFIGSEFLCFLARKIFYLFLSMSNQYDERQNHKNKTRHLWVICSFSHTVQLRWRRVRSDVCQSVQALRENHTVKHKIVLFIFPSIVHVSTQQGFYKTPSHRAIEELRLFLLCHQRQLLKEYYWLSKY